MCYNICCTKKDWRKPMTYMTFINIITVISIIIIGGIIGKKNNAVCHV